MPVLKTLVEPDTKALFQASAARRGLSESELLRAVVLAALHQGESETKPVEVDPEKTETDRMTVRMPRFILDAAKERAKEKGMAPSRWIAALVQSHLSGEPVMTDSELEQLRAITNELSAIGRNLNQIAREVNRLHYTGGVSLEALQQMQTLEVIAELKAIVLDHRAATRSVIRASQNAWEAGRDDN